MPLWQREKIQEVLWKECCMKPYQVNLFNESDQTPAFLPAEPIFIYNNRKYLNFSQFDCFYRHNNEYLIETARLNIDSKLHNINHIGGLMEDITKAMNSFKKLDSIIVFPDEISAVYAALSIFGSKTTFFVDYETSPIVCALLQYRNVEFYNHNEPEQLAKMLSAHSEKVIVIDGLYEWLGYAGQISNIIRISKENQATIIANELNSFGFLGRDGRGFVDLFNIYDDINIEIGSFSKYLGGYGAYLGAKKYLTSKIAENTRELCFHVPDFMLAVNIAGIELLRNESKNKALLSKLWTHSRFFINRIKQIGLKTMSETPIIVVIFNNNDEAENFGRRLFHDGIIVSVNKERLRMIISVDHSRSDLDYVLDRLETHFKDMGIIYPSVKSGIDLK